MRLSAPRILRKIFAPRDLLARFASGFPLDLALRAHSFAPLRARQCCCSRPRWRVRLAEEITCAAGPDACGSQTNDTAERSERLAEELDATATGWSSMPPV